jgi:hypothetical protein
MVPVPVKLLIHVDPVKKIYGSRKVDKKILEILRFEKEVNK